MLLFNNLEYDPRVVKSAIALAEAGYSVDILAVRMKGKYEENIIGNNVVLKRIFPNLFVISAPHRYLFNLLQLCKYAAKNKKKLSFIQCNDAETLPFGFFLKLFNRNAMVVYDAHEYIRSYLPLPKSIVKKVGFAVQFWLYALFEKIFIRSVDAVISVSESLLQQLIEDYRLTCRTVCIYNSLDGNKTSSNYLLEKFDIRQNNKIIIFTGTLDKSREIENLIHVLRHLDDGYCLVLLGLWSSDEYRNSIHGMIKALDLSGRVFEGFIPYHDLIGVISKATFSIFISNPSTLTLKYSMPNKLWESIAAGVPFVTNSGLHEISRLVSIYDIGIVADSTDPRRIAEDIQKSILTGRYSVMKDNLKAVKDIVGWNNEKMKLISLYRELE